jgi:phosphoglycolate phosphatase-like HAD superfamily hydrolase/ADP-ribose pyrophosphatase YjhB (NUDIX family)
VDDLPAVWRATNYVLVKSECPEMSLEQFRAEFCLPFTSFYDRHIPHVPMPQLEDWFHSRFRQVQESVCPLLHAKEFLEFCQTHSIRMFLLSTIHRDHFVVQAGVTGFGEYLEKAYVNIWDKRNKIHEILSDNALRPEETLFIGDMQHDIETAKHGGIHSCAVLTGYNTLQQLRTAGPDLIVEHLGELREILERSAFHLHSGTHAFEDDHRPTVTVGALIYNSVGQALLVRTHKWSDLWGIPGGKIKWGEPSETALRREIKEETNLDIVDIEFVMAQDCIHSKEFNRDAHFILLNYTCRCIGDSSVILNDEARDFRWVNQSQALEMPVNEPTRRLLIRVESRLEEVRLRGNYGEDHDR